MFFLAFAGSIRIFTLFLNLGNSEIFLIPAIILLAIIFAFFQDKTPSWAKTWPNMQGRNPEKSPLLIGEGQGEVYSKTPMDSSAKASEWQKQRIKHFIKNLLRWIIANFIAIMVISWHLYHKNPEYFKQFIWIKNIEYTTPERKTFNDFVRISDTQKYHRYYAETQNWKTYALNSEKDYHIWDIIYLSASQKDLDFSNIFSLSWNAIFTKEFWNYDFNYDKWLFMKWVDGSMYEKASFNVNCENKNWIQDCSKFTMEWKSPHFKPLGKIDKIRARMQNTVISIFWENKYSWLLLGLFIGDKSMIPSDNYDTFVDSWLVHIIAVSGGNIAMVLILLSFLLSFLPFYVRNGFLIVWIIFYAMICGSDASVFRAAVMWSLTLIALFRGREISIRRSMMYAFMAILIFNPFSLWYDIGFILSFWAIIWIVLFQKFSQNLIEKRKEKKKWNKKDKSDFFDCKFWKEYLVPTIWASLWTAPILIFFMNWVNLVGILLNVIIVPIIPIVTIYGFISLILSLIIKRTIRIRPEKLLMNIIYGLSQFWAKYAIFLQSGDIWKKYVLVALFIWLWIFAYLRIYHKKQISPNPSLSRGEKNVPPWQRWKPKAGGFEKNQIFDEIIDNK
jgi:ComEC/Rec2-related protein